MVGLAGFKLMKEPTGGNEKNAVADPRFSSLETYINSNMLCGG